MGHNRVSFVEVSFIEWVYMIIIHCTSMGENHSVLYREVSLFGASFSDISYRVEKDTSNKGHLSIRDTVVLPNSVLQSNI